MNKIKICQGFGQDGPYFSQPMHALSFNSMVNFSVSVLYWLFYLTRTRKDHVIYVSQKPKSI